MHLKVSNTATFKKLLFYQFSSSLLLYFLKSKTPSVIPFWMSMKGARSKVPLSGHFKWLSQCQDWFTKSGGHARSLKLETWNFAWDHISPIHMLCKKVGLIWEHFEKKVQPNCYTNFNRFHAKLFRQLTAGILMFLNMLESQMAVHWSTWVTIFYQIMDTLTNLRYLQELWKHYLAI